MGLHTVFADGLIFTSDRFFERQGAYGSLPQRPTACDKCHSNAGGFYAHGRYLRSLTTLKNWALTKVKVWRHRWFCLNCERTMSTGPECVLPYIRICSLVVAALLWHYLDGQSGIQHAVADELADTVEPRTLARYLKRAKAIAIKTQQAIREVLIEQKEPRPWEECFDQGRSPPDRLSKLHRNPSCASMLWRALMMLVKGSEALSIPPCLLMARALQRASFTGSPFLL